MGNKKQAILHTKVADVAYEINTEHLYGNPGHMSLCRILNLLGLTIPEDEVTRLKTRDDFVLTRTSESGGEFSNKGPALEVPTDKATITVPAEVKGTYQSSYDSFTFLFDPKATISGKKFFLTSGLESIIASPKKLSIKVTGFLGSFLSQEIDLA